MKATKVIGTLLAVCTMSIATVAQEEKTSGWTPSVTIETVVADKYLFNSGSIIYNAPVIQTDILISFENGLYLDLWNSTPARFSVWNENYGTEQDFTLGWAGALESLGVGGFLGSFDVDLSTSFWDEPKLATFGADDVYNLTFSIGHDVPYDSTGTNVVHVAVEFEQSWVLPGSSYGGGSLTSFDVNKEQSLGEILTANVSMRLMYDDGRFDADNGFILGGDVGLEWSITDHLSLHLPRVAWTTPVTVNDDRKLTAAVAAGIGLSF